MNQENAYNECSGGTTRPISAAPPPIANAATPAKFQPPRPP